MFPGADKKKEIPGAATAAREGLRSDNKLHATIVSSYRHYQQIQDFVSDAATSKLSRGRIGM